MGEKMIKKNKLVSVIMSEFNTEEKKLKESIDSILKQSYMNFELIIIDDCGKNNVKKIVNEFNDQRIKVIKNDKNSGLVISLNKAIELAKGDYIARMDTDDYSYCDRIKKQLEFLEAHKDIDLVCSNCNFFDGKAVWGSSGTEYGIISRNQLLNGNPIMHPTVMMKTSSIKKIGGYKNFKRCEDYATWIEFYNRGFKMYKMPNVFLRYHLSLDDYKKRTLKTRKEFFTLLKTQYLKLNPTFLQLLKIYIKTFIAGILPKQIIFKYHKRKFNKQVI